MLEAAIFLKHFLFLDMFQTNDYFSVIFFTLLENK